MEGCVKEGGSGGGIVREGGSGGGMCDGGEERWRDVRQIGRIEDRSGARERNK